MLWSVMVEFSADIETVAPNARRNDPSGTLLASMMVGKTNKRTRCAKMKRFGWIAVVLSLLAGPALAQNQSQIQGVLNGSKNCPGCNLFQAPFSYKELQDANFAGARLTQADMTVTVLTRANLAGANLAHANMFGTTITNGNLSNADLTNTNLSGSWLLGANLSGATMSGTVLSGARMETTRGLSQSMLNRACGDSETQLPPGLTIPHCQ